jgi:hypothetical protein
MGVSLKIVEPYAYVMPEVATYDLLPPASDYTNVKYNVLADTGAWVTLNKRRAGTYISDGTQWKRLGEITVSDSDLQLGTEKLFSQARIRELLNQNLMRFEPPDAINQSAVLPTNWTVVGGGQWMGTDWTGNPLLLWCLFQKVDGGNSENSCIDIRLVDIVTGYVTFTQTGMQVPNVGLIQAGAFDGNGNGFGNLTAYPGYWRIEIKKSASGIQDDRQYKFYGAMITDTLPTVGI